MKRNLIKLVAIMLTATILLGLSSPLAMANADKVEGFVTRLYNNVLERNPDKGGLANWVNLLKNGTQTGASVAYGFFFSAEMKTRNLSNAQFVDVLYTTLMDRTADSGGRANWVNNMSSGMTREGVFEGFVMSPEFDGICKSYGIIRGTYKAPSSGITKQPSSNERGNTAGNLHNEGVVAQSSDRIFFQIGFYGERQLSGYTPGLYAVNKDGTGLTELMAGNFARSLNVVGDWIYYINYDYTSVNYSAIWRMRTDGADKTMLYASNDLNIWGMRVVGDWIYYQLDRNGYDPTQQRGIYTTLLCRMRTDGTDRTVLREFAFPVENGNIFSSNIDIVGNWIYLYVKGTDKYIFDFVTGTTKKDPIIDVYEGFWRMRTDGTGLTKIAGYASSKSGEKNSITNLTVTGDWMYYTHMKEIYDDRNEFVARTNILYRMKTDGSERTELGRGILGYNIYGDLIYFIKEGKIFQMKLDGANQKLISELDYGLANDILVVDGWVFCYPMTNLPKPGGGPLDSAWAFTFSMIRTDGTDRRDLYSELQGMVW